LHECGREGTNSFWQRKGVDYVICLGKKVRTTANLNDAGQWVSRKTKAWAGKNTKRLDTYQEKKM